MWIDDNNANATTIPRHLVSLLHANADYAGPPAGLLGRRVEWSLTLQPGDWVQTDSGEVGRVVHISRLTVFVAFSGARRGGPCIGVSGNPTHEDQSALANPAIANPPVMPPAHLITHHLNMQSEFAIVGFYCSATEAHLAKQLLESHGIRAFILDEHSSTEGWWNGFETKLQVPTDDAIRARELLARP